LQANVLRLDSVCGTYTVEERERAVFQLHDNTLQTVQSLRQFQQVQNDRSVRAEHLTAVRKKKKRLVFVILLIIISA
jgi:hypothetical protein